MGILGWIGVVIVALGVIVLVFVFPDLRRYLRIHRM